ncbi:MAG: right-handed parallel beta-helix repeat-containing protein, partial [Candidatus Heimdallarchaeota archaeon]|nr:right-handed parallel beta-helix repeat-containing protein [Candidatus Heimdallarchaeota archaeon]MCK4876062.1 right-handed parallel beta-helix repeat-containing protein [Candidatus Heimdallarchaeota archaeon]
DCSVMNTASMNNMYAILAEFSPATKIKDCICSTNFYDTADLVKDGVGIQLTKSNNSLVENSYCSNFDSGIYVYRSHFTEIRNNYLELNWYGIATWTNDLTIKENTIQENFEGITIFAGAGLPATNIIIKNNIIKQSVYYGVSLYSYSHDNIVHHNNFEDNYPTGTSQAKDDGTNNVWYDDSVDEGNFWSDWSGSGSYAIDGTAGSVDLYPFSSSSIPEFSSWGLFILLSLIPVLIIPIVRRTKS